MERPKLLGAVAVVILALNAPAAESKAPSPAKVENAVAEGALATLKLTPQAEQRLGIVLMEVARKKVPVSRLFGGEILVPLAPKEKPATGYFPLIPSTPEELLKLSDQQTVADGEIEKAKVQFEAEQVTLHRAEKLVKADAGSARAVDDAVAKVRLAQTALEIAKARRALLGESVAEALRGKKLWIRVPVYTGEFKLIDPKKEARVSQIEARPGGTNYAAKPVSAPASASAQAATVDLFYELQAAGAIFKPGQRVGVSVPLRGEEEGLTVPWSAVLHDIHGNTWVYENIAPQTFTRRRVQVARIVGSDAVLASGPKPGAKVVTDGAAELFGTEFGGGK